MLGQRRDLRLATGNPPVLSQPEVVPVLAVQRGLSREHCNRLTTVRDDLAGQGIEDATRLKIYGVTLAGRLLVANEN